jgi:hypothetical protein
MSAPSINPLQSEVSVVPIKQARPILDLPVLNTQEASELIRIPPEDLLKLANGGSLPAVCLGNEASGVGRAGRPAVWLFLREDLLGYLRDRSRTEQRKRLAEQATPLPVPRRRRGAVSLA